jgi:phage terminase small subunit
MRGRKPHTTEMRLAGGNVGHRPIEDSPKAMPSDGTPPAGLSDDALLEWNRVTPEIIRLGFFGVADVFALAVYCEACASFKDAIRHGDTSSQIRLSGIIRQYAMEFGLTPSSRSRMKATASPAENELQSFLKVTG